MLARPMVAGILYHVTGAGVDRLVSAKNGIEAILKCVNSLR